MFLDKIYDAFQNKGYEKTDPTNTEIICKECLWYLDEYMSIHT